ncbi:MAG: alpha/beta hydrolase [Sphaerospermopsis kisseleviana]
MNSLFGNFSSSWKKKFLLLVLSMLLPTFGMSNSVMAAEQIYAAYSILEIPIPVMSLETYTKTGIIDDKLAVYQQYISSDKLQKLRKILLSNVKITPAVASQFLHTQQGEFMLQRLAKLITAKSPQNKSEIEDLRTAIISASGEPEGLTLLNLLRNYPSSSIRLNLADSLEIAGELENIISETQQAIAILQQQSKIEAATIPKKNLSFLANLQNPGIFTFKKSTLEFFDITRDRHLLTDIYIPNLQNTTPVIVISHGLGLDSSNFRYLAKHLASHGFAVVVPNHPYLFFNNRNNRKLQEANEFINRPLDIKYILDKLEKANQSDGEFKGKLNLQQVGIFGQSFGGYTALALAGAKINFQQLQKDCQPDALQDTWNMSLLLQCRALELQNQATQQENINLRDQRIKAAIAVNPITSSIFGESGLNQMQTPVMFIGSSEDTVAPALYEQILPFSWLTNPHKYLVMLVGATHFSSIGNSNPGSQQIALPPDMVGNASQSRAYINSLSLPFFQTFVYQKPQYLPYLNAGYAQTISSQSLGLSLVKSLNTLQLAPILEHNHQPAIPKKKLSLTIVRWGFWILNIGVSLLHLLIF